MIPIRIISVQKLYTDHSKLYVVASFDGIEDPDANIAIISDGIITINDKQLVIDKFSDSKRPQSRVDVLNTHSIRKIGATPRAAIVNRIVEGRTISEIELICHESTT